MPDLHKLIDVASADVYKKGTLAARLVREANGSTTFSYLKDYSGPPVALSLPVSATPILRPAGATPEFFTGLLPEGHRLSVLRQAVKTSLDDELSLLLAIGSDTPGDVQLFPTGATPRTVSPAATGNPHKADFRALTDAVDYQALPGVQAKASASMVNTPVVVNGQPSILKIDPPEHPHLVVNEALHRKAASALGLPVSSAAIVHDAHGLPGLLVKRFDRQGGNEPTTRLALEDASQVLAIAPSQKYSVTAEEVVQALSQVTRSPKLAARNLYLQFLFAWLTGNGDLHAKNVSILQGEDGTWDISPIYDIPCTTVYGDMTMALSIDGRRKNLRARHWAHFAEAIGLPPRAAAAANRLALTAASSINLGSLPFSGSPLRHAERELRLRRNELA